MPGSARAPAPPKVAAPLALVAPLVVFGGLGCEDDEGLTQQRQDVGVRDAGSAEPLALEPGMRFSYNVTVNQRGAAVGDEGAAIFDLTLTIDAARDRGPGESALDVSATGTNQLDRDWTETRDFDPWLARLGPARAADVVDPEPVEVRLSGPPLLPPAPTPKRLPAPGTFFLDVRDMDAVQAAFEAEYEGRRPRVREMDDGRWLFEFDGPDDRLFYFPEAAKLRQLRLEYDPRGYLLSASERIGAEGTTPRVTGDLFLRDGP